MKCTPLVGQTKGGAFYYAKTNKRTKNRNICERISKSNFVSKIELYV